MHLYGCNFCGAYFEKKTPEQAIDSLREHQENCSEEKPFDKDENADGYMDF